MSTTPTPLPRVAVVLIAHDGEEWLPSVLGTLAAQTYPALELIAVDNGSRDSSREILQRHIPGERLIAIPDDIGFGRAVAAALQHDTMTGAELLLLVHDDLALAPDAITRLVIALRQDSELAIVGPKLRDWSDDDVLQDVGMTIDRFGRAENRLEAGELDQGQHDRQMEVLYVSTAGMMIRMDALRTLGGFDARFPAFREDLDLCWRAWLAGRHVAVVPAAVGYHIAAGSRLARPFGKGRPWEARYLAERHTLAAMLKNYSLLSLAWILPVVLLLGVGKVGAFALTRRFGDAIAVLRAYAWNLVQLGRTLRRRRIVQSKRVVSDGQLSHLLAPGLPRARAYAEALGSWLAGGTTRALLDTDDDPEADADEGRALLRLLRRHPAGLSALVLLIVYVVGLVPLLGDGHLIGGEIAPWPESARDFFRSYASPWNGDPVGSGAFASPVQALLGFASLASLGSAWLAQRLIVFSALPLAWVLALRAGRLVTTASWPRILGATLYTLSPVMLGALSQGRLGALLVGALLPGLVLLTARAADPVTPTATAWRSAALLALGLSAAVAAAPVLALPAVLGYLVVLALVYRRRALARQPAMCIGMAGLAAVALLSPWLVGLIREGGVHGRVTGNPGLPLWRALGAVPEVVFGLGGIAGALLAASTVGLMVGAVILGLQARPAAVSGLVAVLTGSGVLAWGTTRLQAEWVWSPGLLIPAALAVAGLGVMAAHYLGLGLRQHAFGSRQLAVLLAAAMLTLGLVGGVARLARGPWDGLAVSPEVIPAFVAADEPSVGPYRVLLLDGRNGAVAWEVTSASGPDMVRFGTTPSRDLLRALDEAVAGVAGGVDPRAGSRLGLLNVRYIVLRGPEPERVLVDALTRQPTLEPLPSGGGRVFRVNSWLPRAAVLSPERAQMLTQLRDPGVGTDGLTALRRIRPGAYAPAPLPQGLLVVSEATSPIWRAGNDRVALEREEVPPVNAFTVPADVGALDVRASGGMAHAAVAWIQALLLLGVLSLALRPPGFAQARVERKLARELPSGLSRTTALPPTALEMEDAVITTIDDDDAPIDFGDGGADVVTSVGAGGGAGVSVDQPPASAYEFDDDDTGDLGLGLQIDQDDSVSGLADAPEKLQDELASTAGKNAAGASGGDVNDADVDDLREENEPGDLPSHDQQDTS